MNPSRDSSRRRRHFELGAEVLESRSLMTGGAGNTFAIVPGGITQPGGTVSIPITISPSNFTLPKSKMVLGIDIVPQQGSNVKPLILSVTDPHGHIVPQGFHSIYDPHLLHIRVAEGAGTSAFLVPLVKYPHQPDRPVTYTVQVQAQGKSTGNFLLGFYLPGDVDGNGVVNQADLKTVKALRGVRATNPNYLFSADANRDGRIGLIDQAFTLQNQGVSTTISPIATANLDPASDTGLKDRVTNLRTIHFTGQASPGARITYSDKVTPVGQVAAAATSTVPSVTTTADAGGNYSIDVALADGKNTFHVTSTDSSGQTIAGDIAPVTYDANAPALFDVAPPPTPQPKQTT